MTLPFSFHPRWQKKSAKANGWLYECSADENFSLIKITRWSRVGEEESPCPSPRGRAGKKWISPLTMMWKAFWRLTTKERKRRRGGERRTCQRALNFINGMFNRSWTQMEFFLLLFFVFSPRRGIKQMSFSSHRAGWPLNRRNGKINWKFCA